MEFKNKELYNNDFGIYKITCLSNNKIYIGQTRMKFIKRYYHHRWKLKNNKHDNKYLQNAFNKFGLENFVFEILEVVNDKSKLNDLEIKYISKNKNLFNIQNGGQPNIIAPMTEERKLKIGEKNKINMLGRKLSEETKRKMSESHKGNRYNQKNYKINEKLAKHIKIKLIEGYKASEIAKNLNLDYKLINNILTRSSWENVEVEGWLEFQNNRKKTKRLNFEDYLKIYEDRNNGMSINDLALKYERTRHAITHAIKKVNQHMTIQC